MPLVVQLCRDRNHHADAPEPAYGSKDATAVDARNLRNPLHDESTLVSSVRLNFDHPPGIKDLVSRRD